MDQVREAFQKVKDDISILKESLTKILKEINEIKRTINPADRQTDNINLQTDRKEYETDDEILVSKNTLKGLKTTNLTFSTGNKGVPADRQTDQQTDRHLKNTAKNSFQDPISRLEKVTEILNSLDSLKKDLRTQFKKLTSQEMLVFSTIYQLEEEGFVVDYPLIALKTTLSESSIRDYIQKILKKEIPLTKEKEKNKRVILKIPSEFKKIASLQTITSLREL